MSGMIWRAVERYAVAARLPERPVAGAIFYGVGMACTLGLFSAAYFLLRSWPPDLDDLLVAALFAPAIGLFSTIGVLILDRVGPFRRHR